MKVVMSPLSFLTGTLNPNIYRSINFSVTVVIMFFWLWALQRHNKTQFN